MKSIEKSYPKVSVIIPTFKRSVLIEKAIESVYSQTYSNIEIIVIDDNGDNEYRALTFKAIEKYITRENFKYIKNEKNIGGALARNSGILASKGDYITFLDDDDYYLPNRIEILISYILKNKNLDAVISSMFRIDQHGEYINIDNNFSRGENLKDFMLDGNIYTGMILIKKKFLIEIGCFDDIYRFQDRLLMLKFFLQNGKAKILTEQLHVMLEHSDERITFKNASKGRFSHIKIHEIETKVKCRFSKKEWDIIKFNFHYGMASVSAQGTLKDRILSLKYFLILLFSINKNKRLSLLKLLFRTLTTKRISDSLKKILA